MKTKRKLKIIPFCISILAVLIITGGIGYYSFAVYSGTTKKFLDEYLGQEETKNIPTKDVLDRVIQLEYDAFQLNPGNLSFRDPVTKRIYTDVKNTNVEDGDVTNYYKNGIMHVAGYFDVSMYATVKKSTTDDGTEVYSISYAFYFFNINHTQKNPTSKSNTPFSDYLRVVFVEGIDSRTEDEYLPEEEHVGDLALQEDLEYVEETSNSGTTQSSAYTYQFIYGSSLESSLYYNVIDWGATTPWEETTYTNVYSSALYADINNVDSATMDNLTFAIIYLNSGDGTITNLLEGTLEEILTAEEMLENANTSKGYANVYHKVPGYFGYTWWIVVLATGIGFIISSLLAVLFYMIWIDSPSDNSNTTSPKNKTTTKKKA